MTWHDVAESRNATDARERADRLAATYRTPADAAEHLAPTFVREISPDKGWNAPIPASLRESWTRRVAERLFLRWETRQRRTLIQDAIELAENHLRDEARRSGVRLPRSPRDTLIDALSQRTDA